MKRVLSLILALALVLSVAPGVMAEDAPVAPQIKNVIYMIPDGGGIESFQLSGALKAAGGWDREVFPTSTVTTPGEMNMLPYLVGSYTTHCADRAITDSAAAGTALSSGYKTNYYYVGITPDKTPRASLLEAAQLAGKNTGMVSTYEWANATPAAFGAHETSRSNFSSIAEQVANQKMDVVLGTGFGKTYWGTIDDAIIRGYNVMNTREDLENVKPGDKIWGNLVHKVFDYDIYTEEGVPTLAEMTKAAITALADDNEEGFFLMVEGSQVDGAGHANQALEMVGDFLAFDEAFRVAVEFAKGRNDTLIIAGADHDTGGMYLPEDMAKAVESLKQGKEPENIKWESTEHTARPAGLFIYAPEGIAYPDGISGNDVGTLKAYEENRIDNTDVAKYVEGLMGVDLDAASKELFVEVTDKGTYNEDLDLFVFEGGDWAFERNGAYAFHGNKAIDLDGKVCVKIKDRYFVPQLLIDIMEGKAEEKEFGLKLKDEFLSTLEVKMPGADLNVWEGTMMIGNRSLKTPLTAEIKFTYPESFAKMEPIVIENIPGASTYEYKFTCPEVDYTASGLVVKYDVTANGGETLSFVGECEPAGYAAYTATPIVADGVIDEKEWEKASKIICDSPEAASNLVGWKGGRDLSAEFAFLWDEEFLYWYAKVADENFHTDPALKPLNKGDSVTIGIYDDTENLLADGKAEAANEKRYDHMEFAYVDGAPVIYRGRSQKYTAPSDRFVENKTEDGYYFNCVKGGADIVYEGAVAWNTIHAYPYSPQLGDVIGLSIAANDNDGEGKRGYIEYGSGVASTAKYVWLMSKFFMLDPNGEMTPAPEKVTVTVNGEDLVGPVAPYNYTGRIMVPLRATAEALGATVDWRAEDTTAIVTLGETVSELKIGSVKVKKGEKSPYIDKTHILVDNSTMVSLKAIQTALDCNVEWNPRTNVVTITK